MLKRQRRHNRQSIHCNAEGSPASKHFPGYSRLPKSIQGYTTPPAHSIGPRRLTHIRTGDIIHIHHKTGQTRTGRATLALKDQRVKIKTKGHPTVTAAASQARLIAHAGRWTASLRQPYTDQAAQQETAIRLSPAKPT